MPNFFLKLLSLFLKLVSCALMAFILVFLLSYVKPLVKDVQTYQYLKWSLKLEEKVTAIVGDNLRKVMPTVINGYDITRLLIILTMLILNIRVHVIRERINLKTEDLDNNEKEDVKEMLKLKHIDAEIKSLSEYKNKLKEKEEARRRGRN